MPYRRKGAVLITISPLAIHWAALARWRLRLTRGAADCPHLFVIEAQ
jgi:hypothetical protein